jgi:hypothetical protein
MRVLLVLLAIVLVGVVGFNVNGCTSDDAKPVLQQVQDTTDTTGAADTTDTTGATDTTDTTDTTGATDTTDTTTEE